MARYLRFGAAVLALVVAVGCSKNPQKAKKEYFDSGNAYYAQQKYKEAVVEYRNAIQQDPKYGEARYKLAEAYSKLNDVPNAYREYIRAADLLPNDNEAQLKAATFLLIAGQSEDAKSRADKVLARDPKNVQAQVVRANALAGLKDLDGAISEINEAIQLDPKQASTYANLGALQLARGRQDEAEASFKKAVDTDPKNVNAQLALGNFYWSAGRPADAEASFKHASELEPGNLLANRALATFYLASNRAAEAEKYLKTVAETSKDGPSRLALADYYAGMNRPDEALPILNALAGEQQTFAEAKARIAAIQFAQNRRDEAHKTIDEVLAKQPNNTKALLVKARFLVADNKIDEALVKVKAAVTADPQSAVGHYMLGSLYASRNDVDEAVKSFREVLKINPRAVPAQLQLSRLELLRGGAASSVQFAEDAVKNQPENAVARLILVKSLAANGELARADTELGTLLTKYPKSAAVHAEAGNLAMRKKDLVRAKKEYETAQEIEPGSLDALTGLVSLDVVNGKPQEGLARVNAAIQKAPKAAPLYLLAASVQAKSGDAAGAEQSLRKAIDLDSSLLQAYGMLGGLYVAEKKLDQGAAEFEKITKQQPKNIGAHTMIAMILQQQGKQAEAQKKYEQILQMDNHAAVAANNLAWMYAESGTNLDQALQLAQTAKAALPEQPEVNDTLGFVYLKKDLAQLAVPPLRVSVQKDPQNPIYHYRLGLAYFKTGDKASAKQELETALKLNASFPGADDAKATLARLQS